MVAGEEAGRLYRESAQGIHDELAAQGVVIADLYRTEVTPQNRDVFVPILMRWLPRVKYELTAERIAHLLAQPFLEEEVLPVLVSMLRAGPQGYFLASGAVSDRSPDQWMAEALGSAISRFASRRTAPLMLELAQDRSLGSARFAIVVRLSKTRDPSVLNVLLDLVDDPEMTTFAINALGRLRREEALAVLESRLDDPDEVVRQESRQAVRLIRRAAERRAQRAATSLAEGS